MVANNNGGSERASDGSATYPTWLFGHTEDVRRSSGQGCRALLWHMLNVHKVVAACWINRLSGKAHQGP